MPRGQYCVVCGIVAPLMQRYPLDEPMCWDCYDWTLTFQWGKGPHTAAMPQGGEDGPTQN